MSLYAVKSPAGREDCCLILGATNSCCCRHLPHPSLSPPTSKEIQPLRFCFFSFDCLRFDWSSSNRLCCCRRCGGRLLLCFVLADSWRVSNCLGGFAPILIHFLRFASYWFALLLLRKESLGGLKYLCSLLCLKKGRKYIYWRDGYRNKSDFTKVIPKWKDWPPGQALPEGQCQSSSFPDTNTWATRAPGSSAALALHNPHIHKREPRTSFNHYLTSFYVAN